MFFEEYFKCEDDHSGVEFQVKVLFYLNYDAVYFEFSCGCCMLAEDSTNHLIAPDTFADLFMKGLRKLFATTFVRKNLSLWNSTSFEKTRHFFCPKDPQLFAMLIEMLYKLQKEIADMAEMFRSKELLQRLKHDASFDLSFIAEGYLMPYFNNASTMPDTHSVPRVLKDRKLPKQSKEALQVKSAEISEEEALTDQQLVKLFGGNSEEKERKPKFIKKKPNKGKAPNAIRKTQKPAKL